MAKYEFRRQRLFVDDRLFEGATLEADRQQSNYLMNVLRLKEGDSLLLFNGRDGEWLAEIEPKGRKSCLLRLTGQTRKQPSAHDLIYCFAPLKQARLDYMVQKAVEMGAGVLQPVLTHHTQVTKLNLERMEANAREAAEQCGILSLPECRPPLKLEELLDTWPEGRVLVFADESAAETSPIDALRDSPARRLAVLVGPEGGFSDQERDLLLAKPFVLPVSLGPRILRADTAAVAVLALVQAVLGDTAKSGY